MGTIARNGSYPTRWKVLRPQPTDPTGLPERKHAVLCGKPGVGKAELAAWWAAGASRRRPVAYSSRFGDQAAWYLGNYGAAGNVALLDCVSQDGASFAAAVPEHGMLVVDPRGCAAPTVGPALTHPPPPPDPESAAAGISQRLWEIVPDRTVLVVTDIPTAADVPRVEMFAQAAAVFWMHPTGSPNVRRVTCEKWAAMYGDPPVESIYKADAQTWLWYPKGSFELTPGSVRQRQLVRDRRVAELTDWARERHPEPLLSRDVRERFDVSRQTAVETMKKAGLKKVGRARAACWYLDPPAGDSQER